MPHSPSVQFCLVVITLHAPSVLRLLFFLQNPFFSNYLISGSYTGWETVFQTNTKHCVKLQFCPFLYLCCQSDRLLGSCDRGFECHLGRIRMLFFCVWHGMSPVQRATAPTKAFYQMSMTSNSWRQWAALVSSAFQADFWVYNVKLSR